jgi:hypothetical protein
LTPLLPLSRSCGAGGAAIAGEGGSRSCIRAWSRGNRGYLARWAWLYGGVLAPWAGLCVS